MLRRTWIILVLLCAVWCRGQQPTTTTLAQINKDKIDQTVTVQATISSVRESRSERAPYSFQLRDATGEMRLVIWKDTFDKIADKAALKTGATVAVTAEVAEYNKAIELHAKDPAGVHVVGSAPASSSSQSPPTQIKSLTASQAGQTVTVTGRVITARKPTKETAPYILKITDGSATIDVVFWKDTADALTPAQKPEIGETIRVSGRLDQFQDRLQIRLQNAADLAKTAPSSPANDTQPTTTTKPAASAPRLPLAQIASLDLHQRASICGRVHSIQRLSTGRRLTLTDANAQLDVLLWDTAEGLLPAIHTLAASDTLCVDGVVDQLDTTRILVVSRPEEVLSVTH